MVLHSKGLIYDFYLYGKDEIDNIWESIEDQVGRTDDEFLNKDDIKKYLKEGYYLLCTINDKTNNIVAVITIEFAYYPSHKMCRIVTISDKDMDKWIDKGIALLEEFAIKHECTHIDMCGRRGWKKILKDYKEDCILLRKRL